MKNKKNIFKIILAINIGFLGIASPQVHAQETTNQTESQNIYFENQVSELRRAVDARINIVNSNAYYNYASQASKAEYEQAIENARLILGTLDNASFSQVRDATIRINEAIDNIQAEVKIEVEKQQLLEAVDNFKITIRAARIVQENAKNIASRNAQYLSNLISEAEALLAEAEQVLGSL